MKIAACEGVMLGTVSTFYDVDAVLIAVRAATISLFLLDPCAHGVPSLGRLVSLSMSVLLSTFG